MQYVTYPHSIYKITGPDRIRYLQGRVTQNLKNIEGSTAPWSLILSPQGKIEGVFYILLEEDSCLLVSDASDPEVRKEFISALFRFKVADQVFAEDVSEQYRLYSVFSASEIEESFVSTLATQAEYVATVQRGNLDCVDLLLGNDIPADFLTSELQVEPITFSDFDRIRILAGFPFSKRDIPSSIFAPDLPVSRYVSFTKGCYAGQEVVEMATARGRPNRTLVQIKGKGTFSGKAELVLYVNKEGDLKKAGFVTSLVSENEKAEFAGLGYLKTVFLDEGNLNFFMGESQDDVVEIIPSVVE